MIKYSSSKQISIEEFKQPFGNLGKDNRWVILANLLPWDEMVGVYVSRMSRKMGRKAVDPRVAIGTLIIKHILRLPDEETIEMIKENPYLQYFLGYAEYRYEQPFAASLLVSIRRRLGIKEFDKLTDHFMSQVRKIEQHVAEQKQEDSKDKDGSGPSADSSAGSTAEKPVPEERNEENKGHLILDATVAPADIKYPTDLDLLNEARKKSEHLIDLLYVPEKGKVKPRTYRIKARKAYLSCAKQRKKRRSTLRKAIRAQLNYLARNQRTIERMLDEKGSRSFPLAHTHQRTYWIIQEVYRQQKQMYDTKTHKISDRIVSISQPHIRPIVRGKAGKEVEFGAKISTSLAEGFAFPDRIRWDAYHEGADLIPQIEAYHKRHGHYPKSVSADTIYGTRENRAYMKARDIIYTGTALGRPPKNPDKESKEQEKERKKKARQRSQIEGAFGIGKRRYDLDLVKTKTRETSESWIGMVYLVMNIAHFMRVIFCPFLNFVKLLLKTLEQKYFDVFLQLRRRKIGLLLSGF